MCRGVLETLPNHNVDTFIALSTPQGGQFGGEPDRLILLTMNYIYYLV